MEGKWCVIDRHLAIMASDRVFHPMAKDVYGYMDDTMRESLTPKCNNPKEELDIRFSKIGSPLNCCVYLDETSGELNLSFYVERKGKKIEVDIVSNTIIDHCVDANEWFYITGQLEEYNEFIKRVKINGNGSITFKQYLDIVSQSVNSTLSIENHVSVEKLNQISRVTNLEAPSLDATLYEYQKSGYSWLYNITNDECGCILGDEMGLGKTLQVIAVITKMIECCKRNILVIAPLSLLENWKREFNKFSKEVDVYVHHGSNRTGLYKELLCHDVVVISYNTAVSDLSMLKMIKWSLVVVDEAQNIKNYKSERAKAIKAIPKMSAIAVTGTPFENHITDIWSVVDFVLPGYLGSISDFTNVVSDDLEGAELIEPLISPIMLRRLVKNVAKDLPEKVIIPQPLTMSETEAFLYEQLREEIINSSEKGNAELSMLQKLRMFCTHPKLIDTSNYIKPDESVKYQRLCEIIEEIVVKKEKVIVFTSYKKMFDVFKTDIVMRFGIPVSFINGDTPVEERQKIVDYFNNYDGPAFLALNPRAAGTGLNITGANHVIHYNLEWNPALEDQASARAYRRGQKNTVFIHRLFYIDTVEEVVNDRIENKREMAETAIIGIDGKNDSRADIIAALNISPIK